MESETLVKNCLSRFLKKHGLNDGIDEIDEIVLSYVISILEDLGDDQNAEENIDVDQFTEMMDAYIPGFNSIESVEVCEWMFSLSTELSKKNEVDNYIPTVDIIQELSSPIEELIGATALPETQAVDVNGNEGDFDLEDDEQIKLLLDMFPTACTVEIYHCLTLSNGDLDGAAQLIIHRQQTEDSIVTPVNSEKKKDMVLDDSKVKSHIISRFSYVDLDSDKKTHTPVLQKQGSKKMIRYRDNAVVNTKGEKFTEIKKDETKEMKNTYINLKPARKYRFH